MNNQGNVPSKKTSVLYHHRYALRALILAGLLVVALVGFSTPKAVTVRVNEQVQTTHTSKAYVGQLISEFINPNTEMIMNYNSNEPLVDEMEIVISTPKTLNIVIGDVERTVKTNALQVQDFLFEQELTEQKGYTLLSTQPTAYLAEGMKLTFDYTTYTEDVVIEEIAPVVEYREDETLVAGSEEIEQEGQATIIERTYTVRQVNDEIVERTLVEEKVVDQGQPTIIRLGIKAPEAEAVAVASRVAVEAEPIAPTVLGTIPMKMTFYGCQSCGSASGIPVDSDTKMYQGMRILSADWSVLPAGSIVNVPGWGQAIVLDTGVSGNHIDMFIGKDPVPSHGVEYPTIEIIRLGW